MQAAAFPPEPSPSAPLTATCLLFRPPRQGRFGPIAAEPGGSLAEGAFLPHLLPVLAASRVMSRPASATDHRAPNGPHAMRSRPWARSQPRSSGFPASAQGPGRGPIPAFPLRVSSRPRSASLPYCPARLPCHSSRSASRRGPRGPVRHACDPVRAGACRRGWRPDDRSALGDPLTAGPCRALKQSVWPGSWGQDWNTRPESGWTCPSLKKSPDQVRNGFLHDEALVSFFSSLLVQLAETELLRGGQAAPNRSPCSTRQGGFFRRCVLVPASTGSRRGRYRLPSSFFATTAPSRGGRPSAERRLRADGAAGSISEHWRARTPARPAAEAAGSA